MTEYKVKWEVKIYADSPKEAARAALELQRDATGVAEFLVTEVVGTFGSRDWLIDIRKEPT